jgi:twitching motility protein PilT
MDEKQIELIYLEKLLILARDQGAADIILTVDAPPRAKYSHGLIDLSDEIVTQELMGTIVDHLVPERLKELLHDTGTVDFGTSGEKIGRIRFNIFRQRGNWSLVGRMVNADIPPINSLGLPDAIYKIIQRDTGLILLSGSTGSGKSTTMAAVIDYINGHESKHIISIEDPIEYLHQNKKCSVEQIEVGVDSATFEDALRGILRRAADVVIVGEMRDQESIKYALMLAETGHLVFSTLHTDDGVNAIGRIVDVFPKEQQESIYYLLSQTLTCVLTQALLPRKDGEGAVLATEMMMGSPAVRALIRERRPEQIYTAMQTSGEEGMYTLNDCLFKMVMDDVVEEEVAVHRSTQPKWLQRRLDQALEEQAQKAGWFKKK